MLTPVVRQFTSRRTAVLLLLLLLLIIPAFVLSIISTTSRSGSATAGVSSLNGVTGDLTLLGGTGISITGLTITNDMSVALVEPVEFIVSGSPIDGNGGTITVSKANQVAHSFWGGPVSGSPAVPTFRSLVSTDIPSALSLTTLTVSGDTLLGANTSCVTPLLPSCYDISNQQCIGGPLANNCLPPNAAFDNLVVGTLTVLNGTSNGTALNNTFLGDTFLNGSFTCVGSGSINNGCLNLGGYTCPMGMPLADSCIPASLVMYDVTVTNNLTVNQVTCAGGPLPGNCFSNLVVLDNLATPNYPTSPQTEGIWYGTGAKSGTGTSSSIGIGHSIISNAANSIGVGTSASSLGSATIAVGLLASASGGRCISVGPQATCTLGTGVAIGDQANATTRSISIGGNSASISDAISIGYFALGSGDTSTAIGNTATASGSTSISVGLLSIANNGGTISIGVLSLASGASSVAIGTLSQSTNTGSTAVGWMSTATGFQSTAVGFNAIVNNLSGVAIGDNSFASGTYSVAVGSSASVTVAGGISIGSFSNTNGIATSIVLNARTLTVTSPADTAHAFALGINTASVNPGTLGITVNNAPYQLPLYTSDYTTTATTGGTTTLTVTSAQKQRFSGTLTQTVVLPVVTTLANGFQFEILNDASATVTVQTSGLATLATLTTGLSGWATVVNTAGGTGTASWHFSYGLPSPPPGVSIVLDNLATPTYPTAPQTEGVWYGPGAKAGCGTSSSIAIGIAPTALNAHDIAIGTNAFAQNTITFVGNGSIAIGNLANSTDLGVSIGRLSLSSQISFSAGYFTTASGLASVAVGSISLATGELSLAIGAGSLASALSSVAIGNAFATQNFTIAVGYDTFANARYSISVGSFTSTNSIENAVVIGNSVFPAPGNIYRLSAGPFDAAHAFALNINNATVNPGTLGITVNNAPYQLPLYTADYATTATTGGTTTLTVTSAQKQQFSGTLAQIVVLPVVTTLANGFQFEILNDASATVTVQTSGASLLATLTPGSNGWATVVDTAGGTGTASWHFSYGNSVVLDNLATPNYPTSPQTEGIWYGPGAKAGCGTSTSIAIGKNPVASLAGSIAIGDKSTTASGHTHDVAIGTNATTISFLPIGGFESVAIGMNAIATSGVAVGSMSFSSNVWGVAIGTFSTADFSTSVGTQAYSLNGSVAVGTSVFATGYTSIAIGANTPNASGYASIAIGSHSKADSDSAVVLGSGAYSNSIQYSTTIGSSVFGLSVSAGPTDSAHAFALNINNATVNPGTLGFTVNNAPYQLPLYTSDFATTGTTGGVTTLSVTSAKKQFFTGTSAQTVTLPDVATLAAGFEFKISNLSTGAITVNAFNGALVATLAGTTAPTTKWGFFTCVDVAGVGAAGWAYDPGA